MNKIKRLLRKAKAPRLLVGLLLTMSLVAGCATENYNPYLLPGAGIGAALGAGIGAAANHNNPWRGAAIGGLLGTAVGGLAGEAYGRSQPYPHPQQQGYYQQAPAPAPQPGYTYAPPAPSYN